MIVNLIEELIIKKNLKLSILVTKFLIVFLMSLQTLRDHLKIFNWI
jgi:hypothetical protein